MWFVSDSDRPTVATIGVPFPLGDEGDRPVGGRPLARQLERAHHRLGIVLELEGRERP